MSGATVQEILTTAAERLRAAGIEEPWREARLLLAAAADTTSATLMAWPERVVPSDSIARFEAWLDRRAASEPLSRIVGRREFWSLPFIVTPATLDPRPDSETLIEAALAALPNRDAFLSLLDLGTGTGCLLLALLSEYPRAHGLGVDRSEAAAMVAQTNAITLGLDDRASFIAADWDTALSGGVDLIVSNPPYILTAAIPGLMPAVRDYDPVPALDGGVDGLGFYRRSATAASRLLRPGGIIAVEVGVGQAADVIAIFSAAGLTIIEARADLAGIDRVVAARWLGTPEK